jgi:phytoene synthase
MESLETSHKLPALLAGTVIHRGSNLTLGLFFLPRSRRNDAYLFHDFCRFVDDIADSRLLTIERKKTLLCNWIDALHPDNTSILPSDFREMIERRNLDRFLLSEIVRGMLMDTERNRYDTFNELEVYCHRVASAVGLILATIFGARGPIVERYAGELGMALQLTNILRDVAEDAAMGRIYLPIEDLSRFAVSPEEIVQSLPSPAMTHLLNHQAERADSYFARAELAWSEMSLNQKRLMRSARLMSAIYRDLLMQMHADRYDVFNRRYRVSGPRKLALALRTLL